VVYDECSGSAAAERGLAWIEGASTYRKGASTSKQVGGSRPSFELRMNGLSLLKLYSTMKCVWFGIPV
jgi:hypothetical protein